MSIDTNWFRCPNCSLPLTSVDQRVLGCDGGHRFDLSKHGTVTLLPPRAPQTIGDSRPMLEARHALLDSGLFDPIADAIAGASMEVESVSPAETLRVADLGCGTGYYAARLARALPSASFLAADRSPIAVRIATRLVPHSSGVVLDLWRPLPLRDATADLAINVFAPRNPAEFARVLRPDGILVVVVPSSNHLRELRERGALLDVPAGKDARVTSQLVSAGLSPIAPVRVEYETAADASQLAELVGMGPSAHHAALGRRDAPDAASDVSASGSVTVSVDVLAFRRRHTIEG